MSQTLSNESVVTIELNEDDVVALIEYLTYGDHLSMSARLRITNAIRRGLGEPTLAALPVNRR